MSPPTASASSMPPSSAASASSSAGTSASSTATTCPTSWPSTTTCSTTSPPLRLRRTPRPQGRRRARRSATRSPRRTWRTSRRAAGRGAAGSLVEAPGCGQGRARSMWPPLQSRWRAPLAILCGHTSSAGDVPREHRPRIRALNLARWLQQAWYRTSFSAELIGLDVDICGVHVDYVAGFGDQSPGTRVPPQCGAHARGPAAAHC
mmetsp:Transcript_20760/g.69641  ORF Transcript_20760/g.69641 Transcript_20760/m.69641 type:complete len:205 (+) Transcript_20760:785-1399(+)